MVGLNSHLCFPDTASGKQLWATVLFDWLIGVANSPDGKRLACVFSNPEVLIVDADNGKVVQTLKGHTHPIHSVAYSPDGKRLVSGSSAGDGHRPGKPESVKVWDLETGQQAVLLEVPRPVAAGAWPVAPTASGWRAARTMAPSNSGMPAAASSRGCSSHIPRA